MSCISRFAGVCCSLACCAPLLREKQQQQFHPIQAAPQGEHESWLLLGAGVVLCIASNTCFLSACCSLSASRASFQCLFCCCCCCCCSVLLSFAATCLLPAALFYPHICRPWSFYPLPPLFLLSSCRCLRPPTRPGGVFTTSVGSPEGLLKMLRAPGWHLCLGGRKHAGGKTCPGAAPQQHSLCCCWCCGNPGFVGGRPGVVTPLRQAEWSWSSFVDGPNRGLSADRKSLS